MKIEYHGGSFCAGFIVCLVNSGQFSPWWLFLALWFIVSFFPGFGWKNDGKGWRWE